jgi:hypothetical protein
MLSGVKKANEIIEWEFEFIFKKFIRLSHKYYNNLIHLCVGVRKKIVVKEIVQISALNCF